MKRRTNKRTSGVYQVFEITDFLREIDRVLPTIEGPEHRATVVRAKNLLMATSMPRPLEPGETPACLALNMETLAELIETLRCCGIAPSGWPQPPGPDALIRPGVAFVPGWDGTDGQGRKER
jgi:hypothetical protein